MDTNHAPTVLLNKRDVLTLELEALGLPNVDHDRTRERAFCSPGMFQEILFEATRGQNRNPR